MCIINAHVKLFCLNLFSQLQNTTTVTHQYFIPEDVCMLVLTEVVLLSRVADE